MKKFYTLKNDLVFKNVFLKDMKKLKWLLNGIFNIIGYNTNIEIIGIENNELYKDRLYIRTKIVDSIINTNYAYINMELNDTFDNSKKIRNFYYQTSYLNQLVHIKEDYVSIDKPIIQINLNTKNTNTLELINKYSINDNITYEEYLNIFYIINIDIEKILDKWYNLNKDLNYFEKYKYLLIFGMNEQELKELEVNDMMIKEIKNDVLTLNESPKFYQVMSREEDEIRMRNSMFKEGESIGYEKGETVGIEKGKSIGIEEGKTIGIEKTNLDNAKKMKEEKIPVDIIKKITGLDLKTINML